MKGEVQLHQLADTEAAAKQFAEELTQGKKATVYGLKGDLGSGKTTFVKGVAKALGVEQTVTSPTFVIEKIYKLEEQTFSHLVHIDAYRLEGGVELTTLGFDDILENVSNLVLIEWPERVADTLPNDTPIIQFAFVDDETRAVTFP